MCWMTSAASVWRSKWIRTANSKGLTGFRANSGPRGLPAKLRMDKGPELISVLLADWSEKNRVALEFIQPGKPTQSSYIERFNKTFREKVLDFYLFKSLTEVKEITSNWLRQYNEKRPHESLGNLTPAEFLMKKSPREVSTCGWY